MTSYDKYECILKKFGKYSKLLKGWTCLTDVTGNTGNFNETGDKRRRQQHEQSLEGCAIAGAALKILLPDHRARVYQLDVLEMAVLWWNELVWCLLQKWLRQNWPKGLSR